MCFIDDLILVAEASMDQVECINSILHLFCSKSGQKINFRKSQVFFSSNVSDVQSSSLSNARSRCEYHQGFGQVSWCSDAPPKNL